jgi:hypothetical protein
MLKCLAAFVAVACRPKGLAIIFSNIASTVGFLGIVLAGCSQALCGDLEAAKLAWDGLYLSQPHGRFEFQSVDEKAEGTLASLPLVLDDSYDREFEYDFANGAGRFVVTRTWPDGKQQVSGGNGKYDFIISKRSADAAWVVDSLVKKPIYDRRYPACNYEKPLVTSPVRTFARQRFPGFGLPMHVPIAALVRSPYFQLVSESDVTVGNVECRKWSFAFSAPLNSPESKEIPFQRGDIYLIPNKGWQVHSAFIECQQDGEEFSSTYRTVFEAKDGPLASEAFLINHYKENQQDKTYGERLRVAPRPTTPETVSESRYTLSHYGLNEPQFSTFSWWRSLSLLLLSIVAIMAATYLYSHAKKQ